MSGEPRLFRVDRSNWELSGVNEVDFAELYVKERNDIQEWIADNPGILGEDLLVIAKEFSDFDRTRERADLVAVDADGQLVVVELKRDDSGTDVHWQAIKYASYLRDASADAIVEMLARYRAKAAGGDIDEEAAAHALTEHTGADDDLARVLNNDQRVMLVSHRFPPEVTSAALWLNEKALRPLVTCITLTPYVGDDEGLHILASTIIPTPGDDGYKVGIGARQGAEPSPVRRDLRRQNRPDAMSDFLHGVAASVKAQVRPEVQPDKTSRWAAGSPTWRYYHLWYSRSPWGNWQTSFRIEMYPDCEDYPEQLNEPWTGWVGFVPSGVAHQVDLDALDLDPSQEVRDSGIWAPFEASRLTDDLAHRMATVLAKFIDTLTPIVDDLGNEA